MRLTCPACGAEMTLDVAIAHEGARAATLTALELPERLGKQLIAYVTLFRPPKRQLSHDRLAGILGELLPMIQAHYYIEVPNKYRPGTGLTDLGLGYENLAAESGGKIRVASEIRSPADALEAFKYFFPVGTRAPTATFNPRMGPT